MQAWPVITIASIQEFVQREHKQFLNPGHDDRYCPDSSSRQISQICPQLFLSDWDGSTDVNELKKRGIQAVLCINHELEIEEETLDKYKAANIESLYLDVLDLSISCISVHFEASYSFISNHLRQGHGVLVHCAQGVNRSPTIVMHFLVRHLYEHDPQVARFQRPQHGDSLTDLVYQYVEGKRYAIAPMYTFVQQIKDAELNLKGQQGETKTAC